MEFKIMKNHLSCFYSFNETVILKGHISSEKKLIISECLNFEKFSLDECIRTLKNYKIKPYINQHDILIIGLNGKCNAVSFNVENEEKTNSLLDMFQTLKHNNQIIFDGNINGNAMTKAFQLLLDSATNDYYKTPLKFSGSLGDVIHHTSHPRYRMRVF